MLRISCGCRAFLFDLSAEDGKSRAFVEDWAGSRHERVQKILSSLEFF